MEDAIVLYSMPEHLNTMQLLAIFIAKHHPSIPLTLLSFADDAAVTAISAVPSITYRRIPSTELPEDPTRQEMDRLFEFPRLNNPNLRAVLEEISEKSRIRAFVIDCLCNYAVEVATSLNIPTYFYVSPGSFTVCFALYFPTLAENISTDIGDLREFLEIPGNPLIYSLDFPLATKFRGTNMFNHVLDVSKNLRKSCGIITNGFDALDFRAKQAVENGLCVPDGPTPPLYLMGPLVAEASGGGDQECLWWLDTQPAKSVIFLCFGRWGSLSGEQLREMAVALEKCGHRFLWSVPGKTMPELDEGFLERTKDRGFVLESWAPQREVLSHDAVAGFVTHCGRSSILEAVVNGVPMISWPLYGEQRINRGFMVNEMQVALPLEEEPNGFVTAVEFEKRLRELMDDSKRSRDVGYLRRRRFSFLRRWAASSFVAQATAKGSDCTGTRRHESGSDFPFFGLLTTTAEHTTRPTHTSGNSTQSTHKVATPTPLITLTTDSRRIERRGSSTENGGVAV